VPAFWAGLVGAYWYVWTGFWGPDGHLVALGLLVLSFLHWLPQRYAAVKKSWFFWAILLFGGYVALRGLAGYWQQPSTGHQQLSDVVQLFYIGGVVSLLLTPWFLGKEGKFRIEFSVFLIFLGFLINIGLLVEWEAGWQGIQDQLLRKLKELHLLWYYSMACADVVDLYCKKVFCIVAQQERFQKNILVCLGLI